MLWHHSPVTSRHTQCVSKSALPVRLLPEQGTPGTPQLTVVYVRPNAGTMLHVMLHMHVRVRDREVHDDSCLEPNERHGGGAVVLVGGGPPACLPAHAAGHTKKACYCCQRCLVVSSSRPAAATHRCMDLIQPRMHHCRRFMTAYVHARLLGVDARWGTGSAHARKTMQLAHHHMPRRGKREGDDIRRSHVPTMHAWQQAWHDGLKLGSGDAVQPGRKEGPCFSP